MHYLNCAKVQWYEGWEGIPMYDYSGKEGVFIVILECVYLSVCQRASTYGLVWDNQRLGLQQGHRWPWAAWQGDSRRVSDLVDASLGY